MPSASSVATEVVREGQRIMRICNACRYCEGFCAVFPALERRLEFSEGDLNYLANLCHHCGSCYHACQYAPPHEFALNLPKTLAEIRAQTYKKYAWPPVSANLFERNGLAVSMITAASVVLFICVMLVSVEPSILFAVHRIGVSSFYALVPHRVMAWTFGAVALYALTIMVVAFARFWRDTGENGRALLNPGAFAQAASDALTLTYLGGGGDGCTDSAERPSQLRRWFHHLTFYGFMSCFAATVVATMYHYLFGWEAPYARLSVPVVLGVVGGAGLLIGPAGLFWLKRRRDPAMSDRNQTGMDVGFLVSLFLTSLTGLLLLALRETAAMGILLTIHLGVVMGLFLTLPYGKSVHAIYRLAALLRYALERRRPLPNLTSE